MRMPRRTAATAALLVLAGATAGCGGGTSAATLLARAPDKTLAAKTAQFSVDATAAASGQTITERGDGVVDFGAHEVDVVFGRPADSGQPDRQLRTIIIGGDIWSTTPPSLKSGHPDAKPFVHTTTAAVSANPLAQLSQPDDPTRVLGELKGIQGAGIKKTGKEKVRGFDTTHYTGTVDLASVAAKDPGAEPQAAALQKLLNTNIVPVDVWLDKDGRVRRVRMTLQHIKIASAATPATTTTVAGQAATTPSTASTGGLQVDLVLTNEFAAFGTVVNVTAPPADQVMEAPATKG